MTPAVKGKVSFIRKLRGLLVDTPEDRVGFLQLV